MTEKEKQLRAEFIERIAEQINEDFDHDPSEPRVNAYICNECAHVEFTVDVSEGSTPMAIPCLRPPEGKTSEILGPDGQPVTKEQRCGGTMSSAFYAVKADDYKLEDVAYEWRHPTVEFYLQLRRRNQLLANHVMTGGLLLCNRVHENPVVLHSGELMHESGELLNEDEVAARRESLEKLLAVCALHADAIRRKRVKREQGRAKARSARKKKNAHRKKNRKK